MRFLLYMDIYTYFKNIIIVSKNRFRQICLLKSKLTMGILFLLTVSLFRKLNNNKQDIITLKQNFKMLANLSFESVPLVFGCQDCVRKLFL